MDVVESAGRGYPPQVHWSCAGVIRLSTERGFQSSLTRNGIHNADRNVQTVEHRPLLDMKLDVTERARSELRFLESVRIQTKITNSLGYGDSACILTPEDAAIQCPRECPAADKRHAESNAFLFRERHNL